ncbi:MAG: HyaD/HybD family hydrogenase maturation endopeptidase [Chloroflexi bacterium]|nr:HyaD/HybD family hydrogenase maturation endopeptidase [Chloroflexota bacterium]
MTQRIVVLGLGNVIMSDEGAGVRAIQRLMKDPRLPAGVQLVDGGTMGLELLSVAYDADLLVLVDAVDLDLPPGAIVYLRGRELDGMATGGSVHQLGVADLLAALRMAGREPAAVELLGIQPERLTLGTELSPSVAEALPRLAEAVLTVIERDRAPLEASHA